MESCKTCLKKVKKKFQEKKVDIFIELFSGFRFRRKSSTINIFKVDMNAAVSGNSGDTIVSILNVEVESSLLLLTVF